MQFRSFASRVLTLIALGLGAGACVPATVTPTKPAVVIQSPLPGSQFKEGDTVDVRSTLTDPSGVARVEFVVDGIIVRGDATPGQAVFAAIHQWRATQGQHTLLVRAYNALGTSSDPAAVTINVFALATPTPLVTAIPTRAGPISQANLPTRAPTAISAPTLYSSPTPVPGMKTPLTLATVSAPTRYPSPTPVPGSVKTPPTPATVYPTYTPIPQANLENPGVPASPIWQEPLPSDYDKTLTPLQYRAHQREIDVFIDKDGVFLSPSEARERADFCLQAWTRAWEVFGGYAYPSYRCLFGAKYSPPGSGGAHGGNTSSRYEADILMADDWRQLIQHEVFHAWNAGHGVGPEGVWVEEGLTTYYGYLLVEPTRAWQFIVSTASDYSQTDTPLVKIGRDRNQWVAYSQGALTWYMLDVEISERTNRAKSLDNVLRRLYLRRVGPSGSLTFTNQDLVNAIVAEAGSPEFFRAFFKDYIEGTRDLREWHDRLFTKMSSIYIPPHPPIK